MVIDWILDLVSTERDGSAGAGDGDGVAFSVAGDAGAWVCGEGVAFEGDAAVFGDCPIRLVVSVRSSIARIVFIVVAIVLHVRGEFCYGVGYIETGDFRFVRKELL